MRKLIIILFSQWALWTSCYAGSLNCQTYNYPSGRYSTTDCTQTSDASDSARELREQEAELDRQADRFEKGRQEFYRNEAKSMKKDRDED